MKPKRIEKCVRPPMCGELHEDDGIDPAEFYRQQSRPPRGDARKVQQLCRQVAEALAMALAGNGDDVLRDLRVVDVRPAPDSTQLLVLVAPAIGSATFAASDVLTRLNEAGGWLRSEAARAITRKRAPKLLFQFVAAATEEGGA
jgi:ribosome-binding factor A